MYMKNNLYCLFINDVTSFIYILLNEWKYLRFWANYLTEWPLQTPSRWSSLDTCGENCYKKITWKKVPMTTAENNAILFPFNCGYLLCHYSTLVYFLRKVFSIFDHMTQELVLISSKSLTSLYMKMFGAL